VGAEVPSVMLFLGGPRLRLLMQLSQVSSQFVIGLLPCYLILVLHSHMCLHILLPTLS